MPANTIGKMERREHDGSYQPVFEVSFSENKQMDSGKASGNFLILYMDTHRIPESIISDQFPGFKGITLMKICTEYNIEQNFSPVVDRRS